MRDTRGFGNEAVTAGGPPGATGLCSGARPGSVCVGLPRWGSPRRTPQLVHSTLIHVDKACNDHAGGQLAGVRGGTRVSWEQGSQDSEGQALGETPAWVCLVPS